MDWLLLTDDTIIDTLRARCREERLRQNLTQDELAQRAGLGVATVRRFERDLDHGPSLETFVRVLRVLGAIDSLERILPPRPLDPLDPEAGSRQRARSASSITPDGDWTWGDS